MNLGTITKDSSDVYSPIRYEIFVRLAMKLVLISPGDKLLLIVWARGCWSTWPRSAHIFRFGRARLPSSGCDRGFSFSSKWPFAPITTQTTIRYCTILRTNGVLRLHPYSVHKTTLHLAMLSIHPINIRISSYYQFTTVHPSKLKWNIIGWPTIAKTNLKSHLIPIEAFNLSRQLQNFCFSSKSWN